jgi:hypothetical protein
MNYTLMCYAHSDKRFVRQSDYKKKPKPCLPRENAERIPQKILCIICRTLLMIE